MFLLALSQVMPNKTIFVTWAFFDTIEIAPTVWTVLSFNKTNKPSLPYAHGHNGMLTLAFAINMHYDMGDGELGYTICSNLASDTKQLSFFYLPGYELKISLDENNKWLFFGGSVCHRTSISTTAYIYWKNSEETILFPRQFELRYT